MHEMAVTQSLLDTVLKHAAGRRVTEIYLRVGRLSSIVPESVEIYFDYLSRETPARQAHLHFEIAPAEITCQTCGQTVDIPDSDDPPPLIIQQAFGRGCGCGSHNLQVTGGVGFDLLRLEIEE